MKEEKIRNIKFIILSIICICLFVVAIVPRGLQNDTFYTIKLGKLILDNGIDMQEHFAWHEGLPYTYPHWLYDMIMYLVYSVGGYTGIYISTIVLSAILGVAIYLTNSKLTKNTVIPFFMTILVLYIGKDFLTARAQLVTFILFVLTIYCIECFLETKKKRYVVGLLLIPTLIANIHAAVFPFYFVLYLPYIGEWFIYFFTQQKDLITLILLKSDELEIRKLSKKENRNEKQTKKLELLNNRIEKNKKRLEDHKLNPKEPYKIIIQPSNQMLILVVIMIIAAFTGLLTPIGDTPYTYLVHSMQGNTMQNISEHLPTTLYYAKDVLGFFIIAVLLVSFTKVKIKLSDLFLLGGLMFLTIMSRRQASLLYFVGILVINRILAHLIEVFDKDGIQEILKYLTMLFCRVFIYSVFAIFMVFSLKSSKEQEIVSPKVYPIEAVQFIKNNLDIHEIKLFNEYNFGSYLLFEDIPVFIDSRADVYDPQFNKWKDDIFRDFMNIKDVTVDYEEKFDHYGITHLLIYRNSILNKVLKLDAHYLELYKDDNFIIYERLNVKKGE